MSDAEIMMMQAADMRLLLDGAITKTEFVAQTRKRIATLERSWQACGLPKGDATATLKSLTDQARLYWETAQGNKGSERDE